MASTGAFTVRVRGVKRLRADLKRAGGDLEDLRKVHGEVSDIVEVAAKARVPVRTGRLRRSGRPSETATRARVTFGGARVPYAGPIHWGWPVRNITEQPFAVAAAQDTEPRWLPLYQRELERVAASVRGAS